MGLIHKLRLVHVYIHLWQVTYSTLTSLPPLLVVYTWWILTAVNLARLEHWIWCARTTHYIMVCYYFQRQSDHACAPYTFDLQWDVMQVEWLLLAVNRIPEFHELPYMDKRQACFEADASRMHGLQRQLYKGCCSSPGSISSKKTLC